MRGHEHGIVPCTSELMEDMQGREALRVPSQTRAAHARSERRWSQCHQRNAGRNSRASRRAGVLVTTALLCVGGVFHFAQTIARTSHSQGESKEGLISLSQEPIRFFLDEESPSSYGAALELLKGGDATSRWHLCAVWEGAVCHCTGTAALHSWTGDWTMEQHANGSIMCSAEAFGGDPRPHFAKFCSCRTGPAWPMSVVQGLNASLFRKLVPRIEVGAADASCSPEDDGAWTPCAIMNERADASVVHDRLLPRLPASEQEDVALRKLDMCFHIAGPHRALRVLSIWPSAATLAMAPIKAKSAAFCALVYTPHLGPVWDGRAAVFCPTDPPRCLEETCECADAAHTQVDVHANANANKTEDVKPCWACVPPVSKKDSGSSGSNLAGADAAHTQASTKDSGTIGDALAGHAQIGQFTPIKAVTL